MARDRASELPSISDQRALDLVRRLPEAKALAAADSLAAHRAKLIENLGEIIGELTKVNEKVFAARRASGVAFKAALSNSHADFFERQIQMLRAQQNSRSSYFDPRKLELDHRRHLIESELRETFVSDAIAPFRDRLHDESDSLRKWRVPVARPSVTINPITGDRQAAQDAAATTESESVLVRLDAVVEVFRSLESLPITIADVRDLPVLFERIWSALPPVRAGSTM